MSILRRILITLLEDVEELESSEGKLLREIADTIADFMGVNSHG